MSEFSRLKPEDLTLTMRCPVGSCNALLPIVSTVAFSTDNEGLVSVYTTKRDAAVALAFHLEGSHS